MIQVYPTLYTMNLSLNQIKGGQWTWVGFDNFNRLLSSSDLINALQKTAAFSGSFAVLVVVLAMCIALLLDQRTRLTSVYITLLFIPWVLSDTVTGTMWRWMFQQDYGLIQTALNPLLNNYTLLSNDIGAMAIVIAASVWRSLPFNSLLLLGGLQTVSSEIKEAASIDGASSWQSFWSITIPIISPTLLVVILLTSISGINALGSILAITGGGPGSATVTVSMLLYREAWKYGNFGGAATIAVLLFCINVVLTIFYFRAVKVED